MLPYGDNTGAAYDAYNALKDKISDYFMRCRLLAFDPVVAESVSVSVTWRSGRPAISSRFSIRVFPPSGYTP